MKTEKKCERCGNPFTPYKKTSFFCGYYCRSRNNSEKRNKTGKKKCRQCGIDFVPSGARQNSLCSESCRIIRIEKRANQGECVSCGKQVANKSKRCLPCRGNLLVGVKLKSPKTKALSSLHAKAAEGLFRDPRGVVHYFRNIIRFVHENSELFLPEDSIKRRGNKSRASHGLSCVYNGRSGTWKGWTLVSDVEIKEGGWDLLRRKEKGGVVETPPRRG